MFNFKETRLKIPQKDTCDLNLGSFSIAQIITQFQNTNCYMRHYVYLVGENSGVLIK